MKVLRQLQELCIALIVIHTGAEITLNVVTPLDTLPINGTDVEVDFECGSRVIFVCEIKPYIDTADWQVNSKTYALCLLQNCFFYPPYPADHNLSMSLATETFNLTTDPITLTAERNIYSCSNGLTPLSVDANVKVYVKNETLEMDTSTASQITLTTGCVYPYGMDNLTFEWFISKDRVLLQKSQFVRDEVQSITAFACAETSDCAGAASVQFNSTMVVEIFDTGDDYHICAAVQHIDKPDRPHAVHCSVKTYKVRNYITDGSAKTFAYWIMLSITLSIPRILFLLTFIFLQCGVDRSNACICLTGFILPGQGLVLLLICKTGVCCCNKNKYMKSVSVFLSGAIDIAIIAVYLVLDQLTHVLEQLTQWRIYLLPVAISYIFVSWIMSATIVIRIFGRVYRCKNCAEKTDYICKSCKLNYCEDCVTYPQMILVYIKCTTCEKKSDFMCKLCKKPYCRDCLGKDRCRTVQQMTCVFIKCTTCEKKSVFMCKLCEKPYCRDCLGKDRCRTGQQMTCVCFKCTTCEQKPVSICTLCNKQYCNDCVRHDRCITEQRITCGWCEEVGIEIKSYCCECKKFLCKECSTAHECKGILLKHPKHGTRREQDTFCEEEHTGDPACGYCVKRDRYLCFTCLKSQEEKHLIWIQRHSDAVKDRLCCSSVHSYHIESYPGYCLKCKLYICLNCSEKHRGDEHQLIMHIPEDAVKDQFCCSSVHAYNKESYPKYCSKCKLYVCLKCSEKHRGDEHHLTTHITEESCYNIDTDIRNCAQHADKLAECYSFTEDACLCADCFEQGHTPQHKDHDLSAEMKLFKTGCFLKNNFNEKCLKTEAYCLICKICLCRKCYKLHRRFTEHWIKTHDRNTYLCKKCKKDGNRFPVECVDLSSFTISCTECFEGKDKTVVVSSEDYNTLAGEQIRNLSKNDLCQIHEILFSDQAHNVRSNVYCFICKAYMCNKCFKKHINLESVWLENEKRNKFNRLSFDGFERTACWVRIIFALIPVVGIIYGIVQLYRHNTHSHKVGQAGRN